MNVGVHINRQETEVITPVRDDQKLSSLLQIELQENQKGESLSLVEAFEFHFFKTIF